MKRISQRVARMKHWSHGATEWISVDKSKKTILHDPQRRLVPPDRKKNPFIIELVDDLARVGEWIGWGSLRTSGYGPLSGVRRMTNESLSLSLPFSPFAIHLGVKSASEMPIETDLGKPVCRVNCVWWVTERGRATIATVARRRRRMLICRRYRWCFFACREESAILKLLSIFPPACNTSTRVCISRLVKPLGRVPERSRLIILTEVPPRDFYPDCTQQRARVSQPSNQTGFVLFEREWGCESARRFIDTSVIAVGVFACVLEEFSNKKVNNYVKFVLRDCSGSCRLYSHIDEKIVFFRTHTRF